MTASGTAAAPGQRSVAPWRRLVDHTGWAVGVWALLLVLVVWYATLIPTFGALQVTSITKNSLPLAYLAIGQAVIVIAGGVDLSMGSLMLLSSVSAARMMEDRSFMVVVAIGLVVVVAIGALNAVVGQVINTSGVPDIVVTLATSYIWSGLALWVLPSPGGGTAARFRWLFTGSESGFGSNWLMPILLLAVPVVGLHLLTRRTRLGLSIYAIGSDGVAARLAGVRVRRAKVASYSIGGAMAAMAGLASVAITGTGDPRFSIGANATLNSVAAVVLGGVALAGGSGSVAGVVAAAMTLVVLVPILSAVGVDSNNAQVIQGLLIVGVMMLGGLVALRRARTS